MIKQVKAKHNYILMTLLVLWHVFIFGQSMLPGNLSSSQSGFIVNLVKPIIHIFIPLMRVDTMSLLIRKLAHITEFFILGILLFSFYKKRFKLKPLIIVTLIHGFIVASIDEGIQLFIINRAGLITDVLIDMIGVILAVIISVVFYQKRLNKLNNTIK